MKPVGVAVLIAFVAIVSALVVAYRRLARHAEIEEAERVLRESFEGEGEGQP